MRVFLTHRVVKRKTKSVPVTRVLVTALVPLTAARGVLVVVAVVAAVDSAVVADVRSVVAIGSGW